jgi:hypothetical protein
MSLANVRRTCAAATPCDKYATRVRRRATSTRHACDDVRQQCYAVLIGLASNSPTPDDATEQTGMYPSIVNQSVRVWETSVRMSFTRAARTRERAAARPNLGRVAYLSISY